MEQIVVGTANHCKQLRAGSPVHETINASIANEIDRADIDTSLIQTVVAIAAIELHPTRAITSVFKNVVTKSASKDQSADVGS